MPIANEMAPYVQDQLKGAQFIGAIVGIVVLLTFCSLLAGLTLALSSTDLTKLSVLARVGNDKQSAQAKEVIRMKRNWNWLLCSLIICSVAASETLPILVRRLFPATPSRDRNSVITSTVLIAFLGELLPQFLIPRWPVVFSSKCSSLVWFCMYLTFPISYSFSWLLSACGINPDCGILTLEQLSAYIHFHEGEEKHGGALGVEAGRIARAALNLDSMSIGGANNCPEKILSKSEPSDIEMGYRGIQSRVVTDWSKVKTIDISEEVNREFILKVINWGYSRIPVVQSAKYDASRDKPHLDNPEEDTSRVCGFLYTRNLLDLVVNENSGLSVRDLVLYPLPVIQEDFPVFDLLNLFQLGVSRMAVVVRTPSTKSPVPPQTASRNRDTPPLSEAPLWNPASGLRSRNDSSPQATCDQVGTTATCLEAARLDMGASPNPKLDFGVDTSQKIGIITFEGVLEMILQKKSRDEKEFYHKIDMTSGTMKLDEQTIKSDPDNTLQVENKLNSTDVKFQNTQDDHCTLRKRVNSKGPNGSSVDKVRLAGELDGARDTWSELSLTGSQSTDVGINQSSFRAYQSDGERHHEGGKLRPKSSMDVVFSNLPDNDHGSSWLRRSGIPLLKSDFSLGPDPSSKYNNTETMPRLPYSHQAAIISPESLNLFNKPTLRCRMDHQNYTASTTNSIGSSIPPSLELRKLRRTKLRLPPLCNVEPRITENAGSASAKSDASIGSDSVRRHSTKSALQEDVNSSVSNTTEYCHLGHNENCGISCTHPHMSFIEKRDATTSSAKLSLNTWLASNILLEANTGVGSGLRRRGSQDDRWTLPGQRQHCDDNTQSQQVRAARIWSW